MEHTHILIHTKTHTCFDIQAHSNRLSRRLTDINRMSGSVMLNERIFLQLPPNHSGRGRPVSSFQCTPSYLISSQALHLSHLNCATVFKQAPSPHLHHQYYFLIACAVNKMLSMSPWACKCWYTTRECQSEISSKYRSLCPTYFKFTTNAGSTLHLSTFLHSKCA